MLTFLPMLFSNVNLLPEHTVVLLYVIFKWKSYVILWWNPGCK